MNKRKEDNGMYLYFAGVAAGAGGFLMGIGSVGFAVLFAIAYLALIVIYISKQE